MSDSNNNVLVLADDFTGANDAGVSLAEAGIPVEVAFNSGQISTSRALILNSDSRAMTAAAATRKVVALLHGAATFAPCWLVKKIDSTLRGNPGAELEAMMSALGCQVAVVAPACPSAGRHTRDGRCYVHGIALDQTEFASDPKTPVCRADIAGIISMQSRLPCQSLCVEQLPAVLASTGGEKHVLIVDAWEDRHLDQIIDAVAPRSRDTLLVGSAGLCEALARHLRPRGQRGPLLAIVGSMSDMAQRQVTALHGRSGIRRIEINVDQLFDGVMPKSVRQIADVLRQGQHCVVTTCSDSTVRYSIEAQCRARGLSRAAYGESICTRLAGLTAQVVEQCPPGALYLSGGDVAIAVAHALGATGFQIRGRVASCVPYGHFIGGRWSRPVMTKAGGFGTDTTLLDVVNFIEEKLSV